MAHLSIFFLILLFGIWLAYVYMVVPAATIVFWIIVYKTSKQLREIPLGDTARRIPLERSLASNRIFAIIFTVLSVAIIVFICS